MYLKFRLQSPFSTPQLGSVLFGQTDKKTSLLLKGQRERPQRGQIIFVFKFVIVWNSGKICTSLTKKNKWSFFLALKTWL